MDIGEALRLLPSSTPLFKLRSALETALEEVSRRRREALIVSNLCKSDSLRVREQLVHLRSRCIRLEEDQLCPACLKPLRQSAIAYLPEDSSSGRPEMILHYSCQQKRL